MNFELLIIDGPQAGRRIPVETTVRIFGRSEATDYPFPQDGFISGNHLSVQSDGEGVLLTDLRSTNGTLLNGQRITQAKAAPGDVVQVGRMQLKVVASAGPVLAPAPPLATAPSLAPAPAFAPAAHFSLPPMEVPPPPGLFAAPPPPTPPTPPPLSPGPSSGATTVIRAFDLPSLDVAPPPRPPVSRQARTEEGVLRVLRGLDAPLFCMVNAGADDTIAAMLALSDLDLRSHCLFQGDSAQPPPRWAPFLLPLTPESPLLKLLVEKGWGKGWGSFFSSTASPDELQRHFSKFLMVQVAGGAEVYFAFYDPKVLRQFLPAASAAERDMFFGAVDEWFLEGETPISMLRVRNSPEGLVSSIIPVVDTGGIGQTVRAF